MAKLKPTLNHADIQLLIEVMKLHFVTREEHVDFRSNIFDKLDLIIQNTTTTNQELLLTESQVSKHTTQLKHLESTLHLPALT